MYKQKTVMTIIGSSIGLAFAFFVLFEGGPAVALAHEKQQENCYGPNEKKVEEHHRWLLQLKYAQNGPIE
jgi:hypothetical protein